MKRKPKAGGMRANAAKLPRGGLHLYSAAWGPRAGMLCSGEEVSIA